MKWKIEYDNDTGPGDEGFEEWWDVTDGERSFRADSEEDAKRLCSILTRLDEGWELVPRNWPPHMAKDLSSRIGKNAALDVWAAWPSVIAAAVEEGEG